MCSHLGPTSPIHSPPPLCVRKQHIYIIKLELFWFIVFPIRVPSHKEMAIGNAMNQKGPWGTRSTCNSHWEHGEPK
jgi:hypothetical protein